MNVFRHCFGYSLLEMLLVCSFALSLCFAGTISFSALRTRATIKQESLELQLLLKQLAALARDSGQKIDFRYEELAYSSRFSCDDCANIQSGNLESPARFLPPIPKTISFHPNGVASPASINIGTDYHFCTITVSLRGRVTWSC